MTASRYVAVLLLFSLLFSYAPSASLHGQDTSIRITKEEYEILLKNTILLLKANKELSLKVSDLQSLIVNSDEELKKLQELQTASEKEIERLLQELKASSDLQKQSEEALLKLRKDLEKAEEYYKTAYESYMKLQKEMELKLMAKELETKILYGVIVVDSVLAIVCFVLYILK